MFDKLTELFALQHALDNGIISARSIEKSLDE